MAPEDKELLLKDLCARIPYWVKVKVRYFYEYEDGTFKRYNEIKYFDAEILDLLISGDRSLDDIKPYLRPMSSQTSEEREELNNILEYQYYSDDSCMCEASDWLNAHHFDYRGLIEKGLAIEVTEENNPYKN